MGRRLKGWARGREGGGAGGRPSGQGLCLLCSPSGQKPEPGPGHLVLQGLKHGALPPAFKQGQAESGSPGPVTGDPKAPRCPAFLPSCHSPLCPCRGESLFTLGDTWGATPGRALSLTPGRQGGGDPRTRSPALRDCPREVKSPPAQARQRQRWGQTGRRRGGCVSASGCGARPGILVICRVFFGAMLIGVKNGGRG